MFLPLRLKLVNFLENRSGRDGCGAVLDQCGKASRRDSYARHSDTASQDQVKRLGSVRRQEAHLVSSSRDCPAFAQLVEIGDCFRSTSKSPQIGDLPKRIVLNLDELTSFIVHHDQIVDEGFSALCVIPFELRVAIYFLWQRAVDRDRIVGLREVSAAPYKLPKTGRCIHQGWMKLK